MAGFYGAAQLRYGENGNIEVARENFESAADLGDLLLAVLRAVALPNHELQVIDDYERERQFTSDVELAGETPDLGPDLHQRDASCVVDPDRGPADFSHSPHQLRPVLGLDVAAPQSLSGDARGLRDKPLHELLLAHLQRRWQRASSSRQKRARSH